jgi:oligosaccharide repeat unit polymerase
MTPIYLVNSAIATIFRFAAPLFTFVLLQFTAGPSGLVLGALAYFLVTMAVYRFEVTNAWVGFSIPWMLILLFSVLEISEFSRVIQLRTITVIFSLLTMGAMLIAPSRPAYEKHESIVDNHNVRFSIALAIFWSLTFLNVVLAGYIPLLRSVATGDSGYMDFGIKGIYGFFNAYSNALGVTAFYLWRTRGAKVYKLTYFSVVFVFFIFMTRQNIISLLVESFVVYNYAIKRISSARVFVLALIVLVAFGLIGDLRVGTSSIADLAKIKDEFRWLPSAFLWLFSYFYFNVLNLDNAITATPVPNFDFSSFAQLLPSFLRPEGSYSSDLLEVSSFTVGSFVLPIIRDVGFSGLMILFAIFCLLLSYYKRRMETIGGYGPIAGYSVVYFCFLFSFFENFWFYLPIIFQLVFIFIFDRLLFAHKENDRSSNAAPAA